jgi:hypothetical protein
MTRSSFLPIKLASDSWLRSDDRTKSAGGSARSGMPTGAGEDAIRVAPIVEAVNLKSSTLTRWKFVSGVFDCHSTCRDEAGIGFAKVEKTDRLSLGCTRRVQLGLCGWRAATLASRPRRTFHASYRLTAPKALYFEMGRSMSRAGRMHRQRVGRFVPRHLAVYPHAVGT